LKRGRPSRSESKHLEKEFQKLYSRKIGAEIAAGVLGTNLKTAYKYYNQFSDQMHIITIKNLFTEGINRIKQQIQSYDYLLLELYSSLDLVNHQMSKKSNENIPQNIINQKISIIREIRNIIKEKISLELDIPINQSVDEIVKEVISKRAKV